ncbi:RsiG family protein [Streptomyces sp. NPDC003691]
MSTSGTGHTTATSDPAAGTDSGDAGDSGPCGPSGDSAGPGDPGDSAGRPGGPGGSVGPAASARPPQQRDRECRAADHFPDPPRYELPSLHLPELRTLRRGAQQDEADLSYVRRLLQGRIDILRAELARRGTGSRTPGPDAEGSPGPGTPGGAVPGRAPAVGAGPEATGPAAATAAATGSASVPPAAVPAPSTAAAPAPAPVSVTASVVDRLSEILTDAPSSHRTSARHVTVAPPHSEKYGRLAADMLGDVELSDLQARTDDELHAAMGRLVRYEQRVSRRRQLLQRTADDCSAEIARRYREGEAQVDDLLT